MISVFFQNLVLVSVSLFILISHKADYTLYMAVLVILITSVRTILTKGSNSSKVNCFLIQGLIFSIAIWYVFYPRQFSVLLG